MNETQLGFFEAMTNVQQVLWYIAIPSTIVFFIMMVLTFMGLDGSDGMDVDFETETEFETESEDSGSDFQVWTFRNLVIFLTVFSWSAISLLDSQVSFALSMTWATLISVIVVLALSSLFFFMHRLQQDNTPKIKEILNKNAIIYLTVPERGLGMGKINVEYGGTIREVKAVSMNRQYSNGEQVKVVDLQGDLAIIDEVSK